MFVSDEIAEEEMVPANMLQTILDISFFCTSRNERVERTYAKMKFITVSSCSGVNLDSVIAVEGLSWLLDAELELISKTGVPRLESFFSVTVKSSMYSADPTSTFSR